MYKLQALAQNQTLTMSSLEIAELTGKQHKHILADIRNMMEQLGVEAAEFSAPYRMPSGQTARVFSLPKELTLTLVTGYSIPLRHKINQRWVELESQPNATTSINVNGQLN